MCHFIITTHSNKMSQPHDVYIMPFVANYDEFLTMQAQKHYPPPPQILSAFRKFFSEPSTPILAIVKEAASPIIANLSNEADPTWPDCGPLWRILKEAVDQLTEYNDKFVAFVVELQKLPDGNHVFKSMPQFANHWTEMVGSGTDPPASMCEMNGG
jgi:hypothetical protein